MVAMTQSLVFLGAVIIIMVHASSFANAVGSSRKLKVILPAYFDPGQYWTQLINITRSTSVGITAIMNRNNGPGASIDSSYAKTMAEFRKAGGTLIGYVHTCYAVRCTYAPHAKFTVAQIVALGKKYVEWYSVDGFFIDEMSNYLKDLPYYTSLAAALRNLTNTPVLFGNPGTSTYPQYLQAVDTLVTIESGETQFLNTPVESWAFAYPPSAQAAIVYGVSSVGDIPKLLNRTLSRNDGYIYLTSSKLNPDPYANLGTFFPQLISALEKL